MLPVGGGADADADVGVGTEAGSTGAEGGATLAVGRWIIFTGTSILSTSFAPPRPRPRPPRPPPPPPPPPPSPRPRPRPLPRSVVGLFGSPSGACAGLDSLAPPTDAVRPLCACEEEDAAGRGWPGAVFLAGFSTDPLVCACC